MKKNNYERNSLLHKRNIKIHNNLWKVYLSALFISILVVLVKGFN